MSHGDKHCCYLLHWEEGWKPEKGATYWHALYRGSRNDLRRTRSRSHCKHSIGLLYVARSPEVHEQIPWADPYPCRDGPAEPDPDKDIGGVALCLASDYCQYVTGNTLFVDGGSHVNGTPWGAGKPGPN